MKPLRSRLVSDSKRQRALLVYRERRASGWSCWRSYLAAMAVCGKSTAIRRNASQLLAHDLSM